MQDEDLSLPLSELVQRPRGACIVAAEVVAELAMAPFVYLEICSVLEIGPKRWLSVWNLVDVTTYILQARKPRLDMVLAMCLGKDQWMLMHLTDVAQEVTTDIGYQVCKHYACSDYTNDVRRKTA